MDFIDKAKISQIVREEQVNFIGSAVTPWHAHGIDCAVRYLQDQGVKVNGIILVKPAVRQGEVCHLLSEKNFTTGACRIFKQAPVYDRSPLSIIKSLVKSYRSVGWFNRQYAEKREKTIYIVSPWHLDMYCFYQLYQSQGKACGFRMMLVEEGLASYSPKVDTALHAWNSLKVNKRGCHLLVSFLLSVLGTSLRKRFERKTIWTNLNLLVRENGTLCRNDLSVKYYKEVITAYSRMHKEQLPAEDLNGSVIICTMAYLHSEIQDREDVVALQRVVEAIRKKGMRIYLKPHPRDTDYRNRYAALGCQFLECSCSVEALFVISPRIRAVISFSSTSLVTAQLLFGIKGISILNLLDKYKFGPYIQEEMDSFLYCFQEVVSIPNTMEELTNCITDK